MLFLPLALKSSAFPPWGVLSTSPGGAALVLLQIHQECTGARCYGGWTCPRCCPLDWARSWSLASWWSSTRWHNWNAHSLSLAASLFWGWRKLREKGTIQWTPRAAVFRWGEELESAIWWYWIYGQPFLARRHKKCYIWELAQISISFLKFSSSCSGVDF